MSAICTGSMHRHITLTARPSRRLRQTRCSSTASTAFANCGSTSQSYFRSDLCLHESSILQVFVCFFKILLPSPWCTMQMHPALRIRLLFTATLSLTEMSVFSTCTQVNSLSAHGINTWLVLNFIVLFLPLTFIHFWISVFRTLPLLWHFVPSLTLLKPLQFPTFCHDVLESLLRFSLRNPLTSPAVLLWEQLGAVLHFSSFAASYTKSHLPQEKCPLSLWASTGHCSEAWK